MVLPATQNFVPDDSPPVSDQSGPVELVPNEGAEIDLPDLELEGGVIEAGADAPQLRPLPPYAVRLEFFSGPMDLLLHLVHQQEVSVSEVSMKEVAEQYLKIISHTTFLDLEKASEYLVIAATLLAMKSRMLLPTESAAMTEEEAALFGGDQGEDFLEELRARLQTYELTKKRAEALTELPQLGVDTFTRNDKKALLPTPEMLQEPEDGSGLGEMFVALLKRIGAAGRSYAIRMEPVSVVSFMMRIVNVFEQRSSVESTDGKSSTGFGVPESARSFRGLLAVFGRERRQHSNGASPRGMVIGTFIAILELMKRGLITGVQQEDGDVVLSQRFTPRPDDEVATAASAAEPFTSEFDELPEGAKAPTDADSSAAVASGESSKRDWINPQTGEPEYDGHTSRPRKRHRRPKPVVQLAAVEGDDPTAELIESELDGNELEEANEPQVEVLMEVVSGR